MQAVHLSPSTLALAALLVVLTAGCAQRVTDVAATPSAGPAGARPCEPDETPAAGCFDPEAARRANRAFRDRITPTPDDLAAAAGAVPRVRAALTASDGSPAGVTAALRAAGLPGYGVRAEDVFGLPAGSTGVSVAFGSACVFGSVQGRTVELETGGVTNEGGCLEALRGH